MTNFTSASYWMQMLLSLPGIITAITFHEMAHGYAAEAMGDDTARLAGRLSMNPLRHLDPIGFLSMLIFHFGWAKPVPVNPMKFKDRRKGMILVALSGCLTNLLLGFISMAAMFATIGLNNTYLMQILMYMTMYNIMFGVFNLLPIPPLDGSDVLAEFLPYKARMSYLRFGRYGMVLLLGMMMLGLFGYIISPVVNWIYNLYAVILNGIFGLF
ncbi:MAG: site-2 protease family protein [Eubacteriaceae bacterium]